MWISDVVLYWVSFNLLFAALMIWRRVIVQPSRDRRWDNYPAVRVINHGAQQ